MEFKYRAGEDPLPPLGEVLGRENRRSDLMHSRDLLRREMKERIREEIMAMRKEIEDEVILEMAIEREIAMRAEAGLMPSSDLIQCKPSMNYVLAGSKRKADLIGNLELASPKKAHGNWSCPLCQVSTTSEQALNGHLEGKKHKAREKALIEKSIVTRNGLEPQEVCSIEAGKPMVSNLICHYCNVICNSEVVMAAHLKGKKHVARLQKPVEGLGGTIPDITMSMKDLPKSKEEVMRTENVQVKETFDSKKKVELGGVLASETKEEVPVVGDTLLH